MQVGVAERSAAAVQRRPHSLRPPVAYAVHFVRRSLIAGLQLSKDFVDNFAVLVSLNESIQNLVFVVIRIAVDKYLASAGRELRGKVIDNRRSAPSHYGIINRRSAPGDYKIFHRRWAPGDKWLASAGRELRAQHIADRRSAPGDYKIFHRRWAPGEFVIARRQDWRHHAVLVVIQTDRMTQLVRDDSEKAEAGRRQLSVVSCSVT